MGRLPLLSGYSGCRLLATALFWFKFGRPEMLTAASKKAFSKGLWIRHVKGHSNHEWNNVADKLAGDGNFKRRTHCGPPWTLGPLVGGH